MTNSGNGSRTNGEWAAAYASGGWRILPLHTPIQTAVGVACSCGKPECGKQGKHPRIANWQKAASCDLDQVNKWWTAWPDANIGLSLDKLVCLDVDPRHGGNESLASLEAKHGPLPPVSRQRSGSDGWHYLMRPGGPDDRTVPIVRGFRPGLDLLTGPGCYIVVAPSLHACGGHYEWVDGPHPLSAHRDAIALTEPPVWLLDAAEGFTGKAAGKAGKKVFSLPNVIEEGQREAILCKAAGKMRRAGHTEPEILAAIRAMNVERCNPPITDDGDLQRIAKSIGKKRPAPIDEDEGLTKGLADALLAGDHFARDNGELLYHFEGGVYRPTGKRFIQRRAIELCEEWGQTKSWCPDLAKRVNEWILTKASELWECPPLEVLNCQNGLLNIKTGVLEPYSPTYLSSVQIGAGYDANATCPHIDQFIRDVFPEDSWGLPFEVAAWLMLPDMSIQKSVLLTGEGANGKSVWLNLLTAFLGGKRNVSTLSLHKLESDKFACARLVGKLANIGVDLPTAALTGTSVFKALTGGDVINAERKFEASFEFQPFVRLLFSANSPPRSDDSSHGFFRRWLVIPFTKTFSSKDPNTIPHPELLKRLCQPGELSGLLNRALAALPAVRHGGFTETESTKAALEDFRRTTDPFSVWMDQNTVERPDATVRKDQLRTAYGQVCQDNGRPILGDVQFTAALKRLRPKVEPTRRTVDGKKIQLFVGLGMKTDEQPPVGMF